ncbi:c-type cytochrome [Celeribacter naphthalenivorans]|uniref:c-type cytochrome n=1 Tax=Celeribacter naphthalenivorans TaxID=1614694 RepID=UPI001CF98468|nr:cytochrome c [Celeribacter naphthalenivorans]
MKYALIFTFLTPPALAQEVDFADPALIDAGKEVFTDFCMACHGEEALGGNGPDIQGAILSDVTQAIRGTDQMEPVELVDGEPEAVAAYLMALAPKVAEIKMRLLADRQQGSK